MSDRQAWDAELASLLKNIYRCADRSSWYSSVADAYDRTRPRYPAKILARMQEIARLQPGKSVLEIGAGPGIASIELAKLGAQLVCLEPSLAACELARIKCAAYPNVEFIATTFEEWDIAELNFDAVVAATSFHWVVPEVRTIKTAAALKDNGLLILLWNTPPQPSYEVFQSLVGVYQNYAPELAKYEENHNYAKNLAKIGEEAINSGYFQNVTSEELISKVTYSIDDYLTLLSTLSPYINLEPKQRDLLLTELKRVLEFNYGNNKLRLSYLSRLQIVSKI
ncbi:MAG: class I SAM-dependent methyltransferase [Pleurocapsa sp.]